MEFFTIALFLVLASTVTTLELPSSITVCKKADTDCLATAFKEVLKVFAQGSKEYGVPKLEPLLLKKIHIAGNGGSMDLEQNYTNTNLCGLSGLTPTSITVKISDSECLIAVKSHMDALYLIGTYTAKGKMLLFNINGGGSSNLTLQNAGVNFDMPCEVNDNHLKLKSLTMELTGNIILDYKNLIDKNPQLSQTVLDAMNENSDDVFKFLKNDYEKVFAEAFKAVADAIFKAVPLDKLFLD